MKSLVRCKVCGFVMPEERLGDICPACGVAAKVFEPYKTKLSEKRFKILSLHIHPILLHFPQAFVLTALVLLGLAMVTSGSVQEYLVTIARFNLVALPFCTLIGFASGLFDGKVRFKKVTAPALKFKIILGTAFVVLSAADAILAIYLSPTFLNLLLMFGIALVGSGCAAVLGKIGSSLFEASMPG